MKEWCLEHPYLTFFIVISSLSTLNSVVNKIVDLFMKPAPTTVNMNFDPTKLSKAEVESIGDSSVH